MFKKMDDSKNTQIHAMALSGAYNRQIESAIGRPLTDNELVIVDRARVLRQLKIAEKKSKVKSNDAARKRSDRDADRLVPYREPAENLKKKRADLEKNPSEWLRFFLSGRFPFPFGAVHLEIIESCIKAMTQGTSITVAAPRGFGKTSILWGMSLYGVLVGLCRFPVVIGWKADASKELLEQWMQAISENERLREYYPCQCDAFFQTTQSVRLKTLIRDIKTGELCGCDVRKSRDIIIIPSVKESDVQRGHVALAAGSMNGSIKGKNIGLITGENLRPDVVLLDDPQDEETSDSPDQVKKVIKKIDYGIRSLSGPKKRLTVMAAVTCVSENDVSAHLLTRRGTKFFRMGQIMTWPKGWNDDDSKIRKLWDEWNDTRIIGLEKEDGGNAARCFYKENKEILTKGMSVSWEHRYHEGDEEREGDPDALFAAMWDFYDLGEYAFMAERQNQPIIEGVDVLSLKLHVVLSRKNKLKHGVIPDWSEVITFATDINPTLYLSSVCACFGRDMTASVLWYGRYKDKPLPTNDKMSTTEFDAAVYGALKRHGERDLLNLPRKPDLWAIDANGDQSRAAKRFCVEWNRIHKDIKAIPVYGRSGKSARVSATNKKIRQRGDNWLYCREKDINLGLIEWIVYHSDYWKEIEQRAWTTETGSPGGCSLPVGYHEDFAKEVCNERLCAKTMLGERMVWDYQTLGRHDYGDALYMCYLAASYLGIGLDGRDLKKKRKKANVIIGEGY